MQIGRIYSGYESYANVGQTRKADNERTERAAVRDEVTTSKGAKEYQHARKALANVPDVRNEKVESLRSRISKGDYAVPAGDVAAKIMSAISSGEYSA